MRFHRTRRRALCIVLGPALSAQVCAQKASPATPGSAYTAPVFCR